jgi:hypothetical protein
MQKEIIMRKLKRLIPSNLTSSTLTALILAGSSIASVNAAETSSENPSLSVAIKNGSASLSFRLRYEDVTTDNLSNDEANALTLKTRLNYKTGAYQGFNGFLEMDNVSEIDGNNYPTSKGLKNTGNYPNKAIIADPVGTEINQAYLSYTNGDTITKYGRQRILLDNQRFIGGVGFRQNEQTYDAFSISHKCKLETTIFYAHINNVNRIFGEDDPFVSDTDSSTDLLNVNYSGWDAGSLVFYTYLLDEQKSNTQYDTYGLRFSGKKDAFGYQLEYATQEKQLANGTEFDADYLLAETSLKVDSLTLKLGFENLQSDNGNFGFATPLATAHKFQGWADQFLGTPNEGIRDIYVSTSTTLGGVKLLAIYHDFSSDTDNLSGDNDLGSELGLVVSKKLGDYGLSLKYANYSDGDSSFNKADTEKLWLTVSAAF